MRKKVSGKLRSSSKAKNGRGELLPARDTQKKNSLTVTEQKLIDGIKNIVKKGIENKLPIAYDHVPVLTVGADYSRADVILNVCTPLKNPEFVVIHQVSTKKDGSLDMDVLTVNRISDKPIYIKTEDFVKDHTISEELSVYPYIGINEENVVLFSGIGRGVVLDSRLLRLGTYSDNWLEDSFEKVSTMPIELIHENVEGYPYLARHSVGRVEVIFTDVMTGFVVSDPDNKYGVGYYSSQWFEDQFMRVRGNTCMMFVKQC